MSRRKLILTGQRFGKLLVLQRAESIDNRTAWLCKCDCGNEKIVRTTLLSSHYVKSCGCARSEGHKTHGMSRKPEYYTWALMLDRCNNPKNPRFEDYGGRGIRVCDRWLKFENFFKDMGFRPSDLTLDRINTSGNYEPANCRWATWSEQAATRRKRGTGSLARKAALRKAASHA